MVAAAVFAALAQFRLGRSLLLRFPEVFSLGFFTRNGPTPAQLSAARFETTCIARCRGASEATGQAAGRAAGRAAAEAREVCAVVIGGPEPGYVATPRIFAALARSLLDDAGLLARTSGVALPAALIGPNDEAIGRLLGRLAHEGISVTYR
jgi:hypothetical protein